MSIKLYKLEDQKKIAKEWTEKINKNKDKAMMLDTGIVLNEYVPNEETNSLLVDIGGTSLKISESINHENIKLVDQNVEMHSMRDQNLAGKDIWLWIINLILAFINKKKKTYHSGYLTVSYPLKKINENDFEILSCGKDFIFKKDTFEKKDPLKMLNEQCEKVNIKLRFKGAMNDAVATAVGAYYTKKNSVLGVVLGTGSNGSYIKKDGDQLKVINTEWASFKSKNIFLSSCDKKILEELKKAKQKYNLLDVLIGGYKIIDYLKIMAEEKKIHMPKDLTIKNLLESNNYPEIKQLYESFRKRRQQILAAMIIGTVQVCYDDKPEVSVCLNGSAYESKEERDDLQDEVNKLLEFMKNKIKINLFFIENGSLLGSAYYESTKKMN